MRLASHDPQCAGRFDDDANAPRADVLQREHDGSLCESLVQRQRRIDAIERLDLDRLVLFTGNDEHYCAFSEEFGLSFEV